MRRRAPRDRSDGAALATRWGRGCRPVASRCPGAPAAAFDLAVVDLTAPSTGRCLALLDECLEAPQVGADAALEHAQRVADLLRGLLRLVGDLERHARLHRVDLLESDDARVRRAGRAAPGDDAIRGLLGDLGVPLLFFAADARAPAHRLAVELHDLLHAVHELREGLELRPLVVGRADGNVDDDVLLDPWHELSPSRVSGRGRADELRDGAVPGLEEVVCIENVVARDRCHDLLLVALHDRDAVLTADAAREPHDERVRLGGETAHRARREASAAARALHLADVLENGTDPIHAALPCMWLASASDARQMTQQACVYGASFSVGNAPMSAPEMRACETRSSQTASIVASSADVSFSPRTRRSAATTQPRSVGAQT